MTERGTSTTQAMRAVVLAALAVGVSTVAHALAGGHSADGWPLVLTLGLLVGLALPLVRRSRGVPGAAGLLALLQVAGHAAHELAAWSQLAGPAHLLPPGGHTHRNLHLTRFPGTATAHTPAMDTGITALVPSLPMLLAHLVVAVGLGWALTNAERSWAVARRLGDALGRPVRRLLALAHRHLCATGDPALRPPRAATSTARLSWMLSDVWLRPGPVRRGPPHLFLG